MPQGWVWTTLGEIGTWQAGGTPNRSNKAYYGGNIPWLKTGDLNDGLITNIPESITEEAVSNSSAKLNPEGSVLIAMYGATIGKLGILTFPATTNQACCACVKHDTVAQKYLFYFLMSQRTSFIEKGGGGAQPNISKEIIINTEIPLPPLKEQFRIAAQIDHWFSIIGQLESGKENLRAYVKNVKNKILDLAIHGKLVPQDPNDEPASELLKRINPKVEITCDNAQYGNLPNGWLIVDFNSIFETISSKPYQIKQSQIKSHGIRPVVSQSMNHIEGYTDEANYLHLQSPVLVFGDHTRIVKYIDFDFVVGADGVKIINPLFYQRYAYYMILYASINIEDKGYSRHFCQIAKFTYCLPPLKEQIRIVAQIEELYAQLDKIESSLQA